MKTIPMSNTPNNKVDLILTGGQKAELSLRSGLIMLHADCISAQWPLNGVSVTILPTEVKFKIGFHLMRVSMSYQSFDFDRRYGFTESLAFFGELGFKETVKQASNFLSLLEGLE